jgi:hypothetical protein
VKEPYSLTRTVVTFVGVVMVIMVVIVVGLISLVRWWLNDTGFTPLPDEERYQYVYSVKDALDYASAGDVTEARYDDDGQNIFMPTYLYVEMESPTAFDTLLARAKALPDSDCDDVGAMQAECHSQGVEITIRRDSAESDYVTLSLTDSRGGRRDE